MGLGAPSSCREGGIPDGWGIGPPGFPSYVGIGPPGGRHSLCRSPRGRFKANHMCLTAHHFFVSCPCRLHASMRVSSGYKKNRMICIIRFALAEREGFEPPDPLRSTVFKTAAIDHSATSPSPPRLLWDCKGRNYFCISKFIFKKFDFFCKKASFSAAKL